MDIEDTMVLVDAAFFHLVERRFSVDSSQGAEEESARIKQFIMVGEPSIRERAALVIEQILNLNDKLLTGELVFGSLNEACTVILQRTQRLIDDFTSLGPH